MRGRVRGSSPGVVNTAMVTALMVLFAGFALTSRQAGPPPIAEFAPQAVKQIDETPEESSLSRTGGGGDGSGKGQGTATPSPETTPSETPSPDPTDAADETGAAPPKFSGTCANGLQNRFDPQSPPCMPFPPAGFDNGGATYPGVTKDTIKVAYAVPGGSGGRQAERARAHTILANFFSTNFVTYGRRIEVMDYSDAWTAAYNAGSDSAWRAVADNLAAQGVFAVVGRQENNEFEYQLARKGVISVNADNKQLESTLRAYSPYLYSYTSGGDVQADGLTSYVCQKLAGKTSQFAGPRPGNVPRKFAILIGEQTNGKTYGVLGRQMQEQLRRKCGVVAENKHVYYNNGDPGDANTNGTANWGSASMADGVTTILFVGNVYTQLQWSAWFDYSGYLPEWVSTSFTSGHNNFLPSAFGRPTQRTQFMNVNFGSQNLLPSRTPAFETIKFQDPNWRPDAAEGNATYDEVYKPMLILASGIQLAGPNLTPQSFLAGLQRTQFPNPPDRRALGSVGFDTGDHTFVDDALESFWAEGATGPDGQNAGAWCYPTQERHGFQGRADWGTDVSRYFRQPCETGRGI